MVVFFKYYFNFPAILRSMIYKRLLHIPTDYPKSIFLFGPRGTGKTYWIRQHFENAIYLDLLDATVYLHLQRNVKHLAEYIPPNFDGWIILDEVQKLPDLLNEVHRLIEHAHYRFVLTGSSARALRKKGINLLAGRAIHYAMHPLTAVEMEDEFDVNRALMFGQLPSIPAEPNPKQYLQTYVQTYLREEVMQEGLARNLSVFSRFLEIASFSQGEMLNMSAIAREVGLSSQSINNYFELLSDLLLAHRLPIFNKRAKRKTVLHPKFYFFDTGVYNILRPTMILDSQPEKEGVLFESLFLQEMRAINDYLNKGYDFYYWRTQTGIEVDFIAYGQKKLLAFEIKRKSRLDSKDLHGLRAFKEEYPMAECYIIYGGSDILYKEDATCLPLTYALKHLPEIL